MRMIKLIISVLVALTIVSAAYADQYHPASEISPGEFRSGDNYTIPTSLRIGSSGPPLEVLDVRAIGRIQLTDPGNPNKWIAFRNQAPGLDISYQGAPLWLSAYDNQNIILNPGSGNVGIGTTSPNSKLVVRDGTVNIVNDGDGLDMGGLSSLIIGDAGEASLAGGVFDVNDLSWLLGTSHRIYVLNGIRTDGDIIVDTGNVIIRSLDCSGLGNNGKLTTDASGNVVCGDDIGGGAGGVTSVGAGNGLTASPTDPITTTGTLNVGAGQGISVNADNVQVKDCAANQILKRDAADTDWICAADATGGAGGPDTDWATDGSKLWNETATAVGIGTNNPTTKLTVDEQSDANAIISIDSGSTSAQYSAIDFYDRGTNEWGIGKDTNNNFYIDEYGVGTRFTIEPGGNVGIGTTNPTTKLDVDGGIRIRGVTNCNGVSVLETDANGNIQCGSDDSGGAVPDSDWTGAGTGSMYATFTTDNVGIGTNSPDYKLHTSGSWDGSADPGLGITNTVAARTWQVRVGDGGLFGIKDITADTDRITIKTDGNVGIGTTGPDSKLSIEGGGGSLRLYSGVSGGHNWIGFYNDGSPGSARSTWIGHGGDGDPDFTIRTEKTNGDIILSPTGNVGIGTTSPAAKLHVDGGWVKVGGTGTPADGLQLETQGTFHRIAFNDLRFYDWGSGGDMVTFNNGNVGIVGDTRVDGLIDVRNNNNLGESPTGLRIKTWAGGNWYGIGMASSTIWQVSDRYHKWLYTDDGSNYYTGMTLDNNNLNVNGQIIAGSAGGGQHLMINDITGARWTLGTGGYDLTFYNDYNDGTFREKVKFTENGDLIAQGKYVPNAEENLRIIRGVIEADGVTIRAGSGFSAQKLGVGDYRITFDTAFSDYPAVTITVESDIDKAAKIADGALRIDGFDATVFITSSGTSQGAPFSFIAIGPK